MKIIKIQTCHMDAIFMPNHRTLQRQQSVHTNNQIMCYHTVDLYYDVVPNVLAVIFLTRKQMISIPTPVLQFFSHLSYDCKLYKTCQASINRQENLSRVSTGYCFRTIQNIYTRKELVMMETTFSNFHTSFFIPAIQKLEFHITYVQILGTNHFGDSRLTAFKRRE